MAYLTFRQPALQYWNDTDVFVAVAEGVASSFALHEKINKDEWRRLIHVCARRALKASSDWSMCCWWCYSFLCTDRTSQRYCVMQQKRLASTTTEYYGEKKDFCEHPKCATKFGMRHWRHHCKICGRVMCSSCVPHRIVLDNKRVCDGMSLTMIAMALYPLQQLVVLCMRC